MNRLLLLSLLSLLSLPVLTACGAPSTRQYAATDDQVNDLVMYTVSLADTPYRYGGNTVERGFDCSGFVGHVYRHSLGIVLPRTSREISRVGQSVSRDELRPGDLVFFNTQRTAFSHVGIYIGEGKFVHSPRSGESVRTEQMQMRYWQARFDGARRLIR